METISAAIEEIVSVIYSKTATTKEAKEAITSLKGLSDSKNPIAMYEYGLLLMAGRRVQQDIWSAIPLYALASDTHYPPAMITYAKLLIYGCQKDGEVFLIVNQYGLEKATEIAYELSNMSNAFCQEEGQHLLLEIDKSLESFANKGSTPQPVQLKRQDVSPTSVFNACLSVDSSAIAHKPEPHFVARASKYS